MTPDAPCSWPYAPCPCMAIDGLDTDAEAEVIATATYMLWAATGKRFGPCETTVLPCVDSWVRCGACYQGLRACGCRSVSELKLPGPVIEIVTVVVDGVELDPFTYRVDDWEWLVNLEGSWPTNSDPTDYDSFRVTYTQGIAPPPGAGLVTGELACEIAKARCDDESCRLPSRVRQVTRQGVRIDFDPSAGFGIPLIDMWVERANAPILAGAVHSPDLPRYRRVTWQAGSP